MLQAAGKAGPGAAAGAAATAASAEDVGARLVAECGVRHCVTTRGPHGVCVASSGGRVCHHKALAVRSIVNTNGAGDSLVGAVAAALCLGGRAVGPGGSEAAVLNEAIVAHGLRAAKLCLETDDTISTALTPLVVPSSPVRLAAAL